MVKLEIALHEGAPRPEGHDDEDEIVQATNLWFNCEIGAQDLLDAIEDGFEGMSQLFQCIFDETETFYRVWDNYGPGHEEVCSEDKDEFIARVNTPLALHEWHADVDRHLGHNFSILGSGFGEDMVSEELLAYLKK